MRISVVAVGEFRVFIDAVADRSLVSGLRETLGERKGNCVRRLLLSRARTLEAVRRYVTGAAIRL